jgi:hypothetical protein
MAGIARLCASQLLGELSMNATTPFESRTQSRYAETAAYGGLLDALAGIAAVVLSIVGLTGIDPAGMTGIATVVLGAALLIQGGSILSEYAHIAFPSELGVADSLRGEGLTAILLTGAGGIVLGVLALLGIATAGLTAIAAIAFGSALMLGSGSMRQLYGLEMQALQATTPRSISVLLAGEVAAGSAGLQLLAGLAAVVLGILALAGYPPELLTLSALLVLGATVVLTGGALSGLLLSFLRPRIANPRRPAV